MFIEFFVFVVQCLIVLIYLLAFLLLCEETTYFISRGYYRAKAKYNSIKEININIK